MISFCRSLYSARRALLLAMFALALTATWTLTVRAGAREETATPVVTPPYSLFQSSTITGTTNTINVTQLPVVIATATSTKTIYDNVTIQFDVAADGTLTYSASSPTVTLAARPMVSSFRAGTYDVPTSSTLITVSGPATTTGGATEWSIAAQSGACSDVTSAAWYVGTLANSPFYARVKAAKVPTSGFSYGVGSGDCGHTGWGANSLLGFVQVGNQLTILSFTTGSGDQSEPVAQLTYSKK